MIKTAHCTCFGDTDLQASTHHDENDVERCDLCGMPCRVQAHDFLRRQAIRSGVQRAALVGIAVVAAAAITMRMKR